MNRNIRRLGAFFLVMFAVMVADLTYWQVIDASSMQARPDNQRLLLQAQRIRRGNIYDRNGVLLAGRTLNSNGTVGRYYSDPSLSHVIGYNSIRFGTSELERTYNSYLTGQVVGSSWTAFLNQLEHKPVYGDDVTLTIDDRLQRRVDALLPAGPSAAIVADPRNGQILAMASHPDFDANQISHSAYWSGLLNDPNDPLINRATTGYYPPGSTFKVVTLSAALDSNAESLNSTFYGTQATGPLTIDGHVFPASDSNLNDCGTFGYVPPPITLEQGLICSDNIVFAQVGLHIGAARFLDYTHRFGLNRTVPFALPLAESRVVPNGQSLSTLLLAESAFGQGELHVTPSQMLIATEAVADGGRIPDQVLVKRVAAPDGSTVQSTPSGTFSTVMSAAAAAGVRDAMVQVVEVGTGVLARIPGLTMAGKTGTAETGDGKPPHAWFVCFAPADHPRVAIVVMVEHGGEGAYNAAPIAKQIMEAALPLVH
jgi:peptidoglycan glycosyltransferase